MENNFYLLIELGKVYITGLVIEKSIRAFGSKNKADLIKGFTVICCGSIIIIMFSNSVKSVNTFLEGAKYYSNPINYLKAAWIFAKSLLGK